MSELTFITDLVEESLAKGKFRWLANFKEIRRDHTIGEIRVPIYATGGLEEKGFFLSRIFSAFVTPKYKVHFLFYASPEIDTKTLRKMVLACKNEFGADDWIFIGLVQSRPFEKALNKAIEDIADNRVGVVAYSSATKSEISSQNVLGKALRKQLRLTEAKFEAIDFPDYLKSFAISFFLGTLMLVAIAYLGNIPAAIHPATLLFLALFSVVVGYRIYKARFHVTLTLNSKGFHMRQGTTITEGKWSDFTDIALHITPKYETCLRLYSKAKTLDLPLSRTGVPRKDAYNAIKQLIKT